MGELERNMRDDVGQPQGNAPSTDNGGQMDMFEDERVCASLHRRGAIAGLRALDLACNDDARRRVREAHG